MKFRTLNTDQKLIQYSYLTEKYINVRLPLDYLQRSKVVACFNDMGHICGGFVIVFNEPFRVIESIPDFNKSDWQDKLDNCAEVTGLWFDNNFVKRRTSFKFWVNVYYEFLKTKKDYFTYAWSLKKPKLGAIYAHGNPTVLFRGETKILPGMGMPDEESVEIVKRRDILFIPLVKPHFFLKRIFSNRSKKGHNAQQGPILSRPNCP